MTAVLLAVSVALAVCLVRIRSRLRAELRRTVRLWEMDAAGLTADLRRIQDARAARPGARRGRADRPAVVARYRRPRRPRWAR